ncbi:hypothetical protein Bca4012_033350 [Brassica carinata]|uniref:Uncharacterized protein n=2 Tax=Brassica TaxID=3705 RepID=A0ABQ7B5I7_BRACR|nr:hypothetical protein DY000_02037509 [Brassica cretica]KAG2286107.1 hypothetical protein Bca52824_045711 [Brassica carinata]
MNSPLKLRCNARRVSSVATEPLPLIASNPHDYWRLLFSAAIKPALHHHWRNRMMNSSPNRSLLSHVFNSSTAVAV